MLSNLSEIRCLNRTVFTTVPLVTRFNWPCANTSLDTSESCTQNTENAEKVFWRNTHSRVANYPTICVTGVRIHCSTPLPILRQNQKVVISFGNRLDSTWFDQTFQELLRPRNHWKEDMCSNVRAHLNCAFTDVQRTLTTPSNSWTFTTHRPTFHNIFFFFSSCSVASFPIRRTEKKRGTHVVCACVCVCVCVCVFCLNSCGRASASIGTWNMAYFFTSFHEKFRSFSVDRRNTVQCLTTTLTTMSDTHYNLVCT